MTTSHLLAVVALSCMAVASAQLCDTMQYYKGATYDLSELQHTSDEMAYDVLGGYVTCLQPGVPQKNYTFMFDVCNDIDNPNKPAACAGKTAPALQASLDGTQCYVLGRTASFSLINQNDPSEGIILTYSGGDQCQHQGAPFRSVSIKMGCADNAIAAPTAALEPSHCNYEVDMPSLYGCPIECPVGGRHLCSGKGICGYDKTNSVARCFCDTGFGGADCSVEVDAESSGNGTIIGLLVTVLLIALVLTAVLVFVIKMLKAYRKDHHNYMLMHNQDLGPQDV